MIFSIVDFGSPDARAGVRADTRRKAEGRFWAETGQSGFGMSGAESRRSTLDLISATFSERRAPPLGSSATTNATHSRLGSATGVLFHLRCRTYQKRIGDDPLVPEHQGEAKDIGCKQVVRQLSLKAHTRCSAGTCRCCRKFEPQRGRPTG